jgi:para-aminobenzoate synthetase/4-amino-4-deoxychorismate lyase
MEGATLVGYLAYEASAAFDETLQTHPPQSGLPLLWFAEFEEFQDLPLLGGTPRWIGPWTSAWTREEYVHAFREIHRLLGEGDVYQVNLTYPMRAEGRGEKAVDLLEALLASQDAPYAAFIETEDFAIASASPELFLQRSGEVAHCAPMKGTAPPGQSAVADLATEKSRAENLMIVDMVRNDLGRIAVPGSVTVSELFGLESYATVTQMTSQIEAQTTADLVSTLGALFPPASMTGAPKKRAMEVISSLETGRRTVYSGSIGSIGPENDCQFNVAIRTVFRSGRSTPWEYHVGGGIVWDSTDEEEYQETILKSRILRPPNDFEIFETLAWSREDGFRYQEEHLLRLVSTADLFGFDVAPEELLATLNQIPNSASEQALTVQLRYCPATGNIHTKTSEPRHWPSGHTLQVGVSANPVHSADWRLRHKTSVRQPYDMAREEFPDAAEVLLVNELGHITEGTISNVAIYADAEWRTPPLSDGLLPGIERSRLLGSGEMKEGSITPRDLLRAEKLMLFNSVRGTVEFTPSSLLPFDLDRFA